MIVIPVNSGGPAKDGCRKNKTSPLGGLIALTVTLVSGGVVTLSQSSQGSFNQGNDPVGAYFITKATRSLVVDLEGDWRFTLGDDQSWSQLGFDDSSWETMEVPSDWSGDRYGNYDGFAWYRRAFSVDASDVDRPLFALLGRVDDTDEVFVNGQRIGGMGTFPPESRSAWNRSRVYRVPPGLLHEGAENVIAVRVYDYRLVGGIVEGPVGIFASELPQPLVDLSGSWSFSPGDDPRWKEELFDDSQFQRIQVPMVWEEEGFDGYDGYAWYRKHFGRLATDGSEPLKLLLGKIDDTDEVFLNGQRIGKTGDLQMSDRSVNGDYYRIDREYEFSASLLKDDNVLCVRVHDSSGYGGIYSGPVGIMSESGLALYRERLEESEKWHLQETIDWQLGRD